jgi:hypothetical protein
MLGDPPIQSCLDVESSLFHHRIPYMEVYTNSPPIWNHKILCISSLFTSLIQISMPIHFVAMSPWAMREHSFFKYICWEFTLKNTMSIQIMKIFYDWRKKNCLVVRVWSTPTIRIPKTILIWDSTWSPLMWTWHVSKWYEISYNFASY